MYSIQVQAVHASSLIRDGEPHLNKEK